MEKNNITRRKFIFGVALTSAGAAITLVPSINSFAKSLIKNNKPELQAFVPSLWVTIDSDNSITFTNSRQEMGQGSRTTMAMILAEELDADWNFVKTVQAPGDSKFGSQSTGGSMSIRLMYTTLRNAGATAKAMLITAAAQTWGIAESKCKAENSFVLEINGTRKLSYGELAEKASKLQVPTNVTLKDPSTFKLIGTNKYHIDNPDIVSGKAIYGIDKVLPGMKFAVVVRPPAFGASVANYTDTETLKVTGVIKTFRINYGIAVIADNSWAAMQGANVLNINWNLGNNAKYSSADIFDSMYKAVGTLDALPANTAKTVESFYEVPYMAHCTMEPQTATAWYHDGIMDVWASTQDPQSVRSSAASAAGLSQDKVNAYPLLAGGGFGRRLGADYAYMATQIAKQVTYPVKLFFTKADDLQNDNYRTTSLHALKGGIDSSGKLTGWIHKAIGVSPTTPNYSIPNAKNLSGNGLNFVPTGAWRSVANTQNIFANECFLDELAFAAGKDPFDFRQSIINDNRLKNVVSLLRAKAKWDEPLPTGWGKGVATFIGYGGYIAHAIFVSVAKDGTLKVEKIVAVADVGIAINPRGVEAQAMGASIDGLSTAIKAEITIENGGVKQSNWTDFEWIRMNESPIIEVEVVKSNQTPGGMGEVGFPSVTPALCNAIFNATGIRIKKLPISKTPLVSSVENNNYNDKGLTIFPNPGNSKINIKYNSKSAIKGEYSIQILNILGSKVLSTNRKSDSNEINEEINISNLANGSYLVQIVFDDLKISGRFIKE
jgi:CO/xanthine dehydrogenase Mo-binding subunit